MVARRSRKGTRSSTSRLLGQITPSLTGFASRLSGSSRNRAAETSTDAPSGTAAPPGTWTKISVATLPFLTSGINPLLERFDAKPLDGVDKKLVRTFAQREISFHDVLDHVGDLAIRYRRPDQRAEFGILVGTAADRDLVKLLAILLDPEN